MLVFCLTYNSLIKVSDNFACLQCWMGLLAPNGCAPSDAVERETNWNHKFCIVENVNK